MERGAVFISGLYFEPVQRLKSWRRRAERLSLTAMNLRPEDRRVLDSLPESWVDRAPRALRPYLRLARYDRPAGFWLLGLPGWAGIALAGLGRGYGPADLGFALLIAIGTLAMRGAGCTYNDIVDRDLDASVARTANRPLAAGTVTLRAAWAFLLAQCLVGLIVLLLLPGTAQLAALGSIPLVAAYPFMKRITWWPQAWLGLTFNWAALVGFAAASGELAAPGLVLYGGLVFWTLGYDTIYACQDKEDDALVGVKSTARLFGASAPRWVAGFYAVCAVIAGLAAVIGAGSWLAIFAAAPFTAHLGWQAMRFDSEDGVTSLALFKSNREAGLLLTAGYVLAAFLIL